MQSIKEVETARELAARCSKASPRLALIAAGITGNRSDAEDVVQQAIAIAIEKNRSPSRQKFYSAIHRYFWYWAFCIDHAVSLGLY